MPPAELHGFQDRQIARPEVCVLEQAQHIQRWWSMKHDKDGGAAQGARGMVLVRSLVLVLRPLQQARLMEVMGAPEGDSRVVIAVIAEADGARWCVGGHVNSLLQSVTVLTSVSYSLFTDGFAQKVRV
jgi:hypothetical protein